MAEAGRFGLTPQLDIQQILREAQHRWLRPAEICEILRNHKHFQIAPEPANQPPSGSLFLFDRKVLRYFRKDGHNWRKKKDGKTVKEAHERLKSGSVDVLHCYYAHGESNPNFQRRSYWMLEEDFMNMVLVHYREVKDKKETYGRTRDNSEFTQGSYIESPAGSNSVTNYSPATSHATDVESRNSQLTSEFEDIDSDKSQASSGYHPFPEFGRFNEQSLTNYCQVSTHSNVLPHNNCGQQIQRSLVPESDVSHISQVNTTKLLSESGYGYTTFNGPRTQFISSPWDAVSESRQVELQNSAFPVATTSTTPSGIENFQNDERLMVGGDPYTDRFYPEKIIAQSIAVWQDVLEPDAALPVTQEMGVKHPLSSETNPIFASLIKQLSLDLPTTDGEKAIQKNDSFSRWASKELGGIVDDLNTKSKVYWDEVENVNIIDDSCLSPEDRQTYTMGPYLSQDQLFSIADIFPSWAFAGSEIIIFVRGSFLPNKDDIYKYKWSCMFGQEEVPAELVTDSILRCFSPTGVSGQVPFCVTCSNRFACSELREFEFRAHSEANFGSVDPYTLGTYEMLLYTRLDKMLSAGFSGNLDTIPSYSPEKANICNKITALLIVTNDELSLELKKATYSDITVAEKPYDQLMQALLKEKLHSWLQYKVVEGGKGPSILGKEGQGVIHLAAALGYNWAIAPLIAAGLNINFRDVRGWTALHWAAFCGRESTIVALLSLGAAPGALTDPTPEFPSGRPPADLASCNGHKGIGGFLAESSLITHLSTLNLKESGGKPGISTSSTYTGFEKSSGKQFGGEDLQLESHLSLKDSLSAVRNAAQAAARIYQVYRMHSFHRKKIDEFADDKFGMSDVHALSLFSVKTNRSVPHDEPGHAAAVKIQKKFRGWKGRKDFLTMRQHVVKIQAHVRGYQVRKHFRKIVWSVGIVEKAILRWRRKGCGLRGFRSEAGFTEGTSMQVQHVKEDDYDFLREGRKQTEARFARALDRVKSMAQHPEARDQYRRLLTGIEDFQQSKVLLQRILYDEEPVDASMMLDIDELIGDDSFMTTG